MVLYLHLGPFARQMVEQMEGRIDEMDRGSYQSPQRKYAAVAAHV